MAAIPDSWRGDDLSFRDLSRSVLSKATFEGVDFRGCDLRRVDLRDVVFTDCDLSFANLSDASLVDCVFARSCARFACLSNSTFVRVRVVDEFDCEHATCDDVRWSSCDLSQVALRFASLRRAVLSQCLLVDADLSGVDARDAAFASSCNVADCDLRGSLLQRASFDVRGHALIQGLDPARECAASLPLRASHTVTMADLASASKLVDEDSEGLRLAPDVAQVVARAFGSVDASLAPATEPLAVARFVDGTTFERHPNRLLRVVGPPPLSLALVRHMPTVRTLPLKPEEKRDWRSLDEELSVYDAEQRTWSTVRCSLAEAVVLLKGAMRAPATSDGVPPSPRDVVVGLSGGGWCEPLPDVDDEAIADAAADGFEAPRPNSFMVHRAIDYSDAINVIEALVASAPHSDGQRDAVNRLRALAFDERRHVIFAATSSVQRWRWVEALRTNIAMSSAGFFNPLLSGVLTLAVGGAWSTPECTVDWQQQVVAKLENSWPSSKATKNMLAWMDEGKLPWLQRKRIDDNDSAALSDTIWSQWLPSPAAFDDAAAGLTAKMRAADVHGGGAPSGPAPTPPVAADKAKKKKNVFGFLRRLKGKKAATRDTPVHAVATVVARTVASPPPVAVVDERDEEDSESSASASDVEGEDEKRFGEPGTVATLSRETLASFAAMSAAAAAANDEAKKTKKKKAKVLAAVCARCGERTAQARAVMTDGSKLKLCLSCVDALKQERDERLRERERLAAAEAERKRRAELPPIVGNCTCCGTKLTDANTTRRNEFCTAAKNADVATPFGLRQIVAVAAAAPPVVVVEANDKKAKKSKKGGETVAVAAAPVSDSELTRRVAELQRELDVRDQNAAALQLTINEMRARLMRLDSEHEASAHVDDILAALLPSGGGGDAATVRVSTQQSLLERQVEALKGALEQEYAARAQLERQVAAQAEAQFAHLQDAQTRISALTARVDAQSALLARLALRVCDECIDKL
jgi:hypothetical protein